MRWKDMDIPDNAILAYIENNKRFRTKVMKLLGRITGGKKKAGTAQLSAAGKVAAKARWYIDCPVCLGAGQQTGDSDGNIIKCYNCNGTGMIKKQGAKQ